ncbi:MAG: serine/threonine protein kinase [Victivallales bacterium]|nr:serine/threonine protein kinase [Victivallales bacterium]
MADVRFTCVSCRIALSASGEDVGKLIQCPSCHQTMTVPPYGVVSGMDLGDFTIEKLLGVGGMGEVWLATQKSLHRKVALKILSPDLARDSNFVSRFLLEVKIAGKLTHPNIVTAYQAGEQHGIRYLAISYVEGKVLGEYFSEANPMAEREALRVARNIALALKYAWDKFRILHRDIKPDNIMIAGDGTPMLMDMGISKITGGDESLTMTGTIIGTPNYISPEQARGLPDLDFRADQYSLGATLFHLLTGRLPYTATSAMGIMAQHLQDPVPDCSKINPGISEGSQSLIKTMMAKNREDRLGSWDEVIEALDGIIAGGNFKMPATRDSIYEPTQKKKSKINMYIIAAVVAVLMLSVFSLKTKLRQSVRENRELKDDLDKSLAPDASGDKKQPEKAKQQEIDENKDSRVASDSPDEGINTKLKEILDIDDSKAGQIAHIVRNYQKEAFQIMAKKVPDTPGAKLRRLGELRQLQDRVIEQAGTILTPKQKETFKNLIRNAGHAYRRDRPGELRKRLGDDR